MIVKIIKDYSDSTMNWKIVKAGTELTVPDKRGKILIDAGVAKEVKKNKK